MTNRNQKKINKHIYFERRLNTPRKFNSSDFLKTVKPNWNMPCHSCEGRLETKRVIINSEILNTNTYDMKKRSKIFFELKKIVRKTNLSKFCIPLLHGSYATGTITNFSDIDIILILFKSTYSSFKNIKELKKKSEYIIRYIYKIDPLMHHGINIIFQDDFLHYNESILPINALKKSVSLSDEKVTIDIYSCFKCSMENNIKYLQRYSSSLSKFEIEKTDPLNLYELKSIISGLFLASVVFFQVKNRSFHYKGDCIEEVKVYFSKKKIFIIEEFSAIRREWPKELTHAFFSFFLFSNTVFHPEYSKHLFYKFQKRKINKEIYNIFRAALRKDKNKLIEQIDILL